jgi:outer membrane phospholipase A
MFLITKPAYIFCYNCPLIGDNCNIMQFEGFFFLKLEFRNKKIQNKNMFYIHQTWRYQNGILSRILKLF